MGININCKYITEYYNCLHPDKKKILGFIRPTCIKMRKDIFCKCDLQDEYARPVLKLMRQI